LAPALRLADATAGRVRCIIDHRFVRQTGRFDTVGDGKLAIRGIVAAK